jgi:cytidylate kinase
MDHTPTASFHEVHPALNSTPDEFEASSPGLGPGSTVGPMRGTVTISRTYGAGGRRVAEALADRLGWRTVDGEVVEQAARTLGVDPEVAEALDEKVPALIEEAGLALAAAELPLGISPPVLGDRALADAVAVVIRSLADAGAYVILGRGGQAALGDREDAVHIQLVGTLADRARRVADWRGISEDEAVEQCRRVDEDRAAYVRRFHEVDIRDPLLYHAVLNTSRLGIEGATEAALAVVHHRLGEGA